MGIKSMYEAARDVLMRSVPDAVPRNWFISSSASPRSCSTGCRRSARRWPASVSATLRVVRLNRFTPSRSSRLRMA
ncbi:hypothetical protein D3C71_1755980 [compost metagenome]